jgi:hypothetical protein
MFQCVIRGLITSFCFWYWEIPHKTAYRDIWCLFHATVSSLAEWWASKSKAARIFWANQIHNLRKQMKVNTRLQQEDSEDKWIIHNLVEIYTTSGFPIHRNYHILRKVYIQCQETANQLHLWSHNSHITIKGLKYLPQLISDQCDLLRHRLWQKLFWDPFLMGSGANRSLRHRRLDLCFALRIPAQYLVRSCCSNNGLWLCSEALTTYDDVKKEASSSISFSWCAPSG